MIFLPEGERGGFVSKTTSSIGKGPCFGLCFHASSSGLQDWRRSEVGSLYTELRPGLAHYDMHCVVVLCSATRTEWGFECLHLRSLFPTAQDNAIMHLFASRSELSEEHIF